MTDAVSSLPQSPITGIDHPVIAVRDMQEARMRYQRAGFTVPPRGSHKEWGTGNWCIMFPRGYLELRGILDPARYTHNLERFLEKREGLMGIAFASDVGADRAHSMLRTRALNPLEPRQLTRRFELPEGEVEPRFRLVFFNPEESGPLMSSLICEHVTPQLLRKPEFLRHANGAVGIASITAVASDLSSATASLAQYFGEEHVRRMGQTVRVDTAAAEVLWVLSPQEAERRGLALPTEPPYLAAVALRTESLEACEAVLKAGGVPFHSAQEGVLRVAAVDACGVTLDFVDSASEAATARDISD